MQLCRFCDAACTLQPVFHVASLEQLVRDDVVQRRFVMTALTGLATLALATIGIHGLLASVVGRRTCEIGIQVALGASPKRIRADVLRPALGWAGVGVLAGVGCVLATTRLVASLLHGASPFDRTAFTVMIGVVAAAAMMAAYGPARRATRIDPAVTLRVE